MRALPRPVSGGEGAHGQAGSAENRVPWSRLDPRLVWVNIVGLLLSLVPAFLARVVFGVDAGSGSFGLVPAFVISSIGVTATVLGLVRWWKTWYRVTEDRVELVTGRVVRTYRYVPRERIRTVETGARLRHRLARLRVLEVGSGENGRAFKLDAISVAEAERLRHELLRGGATERKGSGERNTPFARLRWHWILYNAFSLWAVPVGALFLFSAFWTFQVFAVDLRELILGLWDWESLATPGTVLVGTLSLHLLGTVFLTFGFVKDRWGFVLERVRTEGGTVLRTREGLLRTREVLREDRRLRGVSLRQPLLGRWMGMTETEVISTGLAAWTPGTDPPSIILPKTSSREALRVADLVLQDGVRPLRTPLASHPPAALLRRVGWVAVAVLTGAAAVWVWPVPQSWLSVLTWPVPVFLFLAVTSYRSLGHARAGRYIVVRWGSWSRVTGAVQTRAVVGWRIRQTLVQRLLGLTSVGVLTAAGNRHYRAPDMSVEEVPRFVGEASPELFADFLVEDTSDRPPKRRTRE